MNTPIRYRPSQDWRSEASYGVTAGRHRRPVDQFPDSRIALDRRVTRVRDAERMLHEAYKTLLGVGADRDAIDVAFAVARDCFNEARASSELARRELDLAQYERQAARRMLLAAPDVGNEDLIPDLAGSDMCPNPVTARTAAEFLTMLRMYHIWAGKPSYRAMARQCGQRFAASTIHAALHSDKLPSLAMVQAIVRACGGGEEHQQSFASAWRGLEMHSPHASSGVA